METMKVNLYKFNELDDHAKETAINDYRDDSYGDTYWQEEAIDDIKTNIAPLLGITIDNIYFSGFSSQGDGACFEGSYEYKKGALKNVKSELPHDEKLHRIVKDLQDVQKRNFYKLCANVKHSGHYYHEHCTKISVFTSDYDDVNDEIEEELSEYLRAFMCWIYRRLESEYEYFNSDENISELLMINEYDFTDDGRMY